MQSPFKKIRQLHISYAVNTQNTRKIKQNQTIAILKENYSLYKIISIYTKGNVASSLQRAMRFKRSENTYERKEIAIMKIVIVLISPERRKESHLYKH